MPRTTNGSRISSLNALRWGDSLEGLLPCKRHACKYADACRGDPHIKRHGFPAYGSPCTLELLEHEAFVSSAKKTFSFALEWLSEDELERTLERFSLLRLRWRRTSCRLAAEGMVNYLALDNGTVLVRAPVATRKYWPSIQKELTDCTRRLLEDPQLHE